jgi:tetratricopeptide (TPR) repeat protein
LEKSLEILNKQITESPQNEIINFRIGIVHNNLGEAYFALGSSQKSLSSLQTAKSNLQKSLTIYQGFLANGSLVGEDAERIPKAEQMLKKCDEAFKQFGRK